MARRIKIFSNWDRHQKKWFGKWHLYLGIIAGAVIAIIGLTGSILVFQDEIDAALNPQLFAVLDQKERLPIDQIYDSVHQAHPEIKISYVYDYGTNHNSTYKIYGGSEMYYANPFDGKICGKRPFGSGFINLVTEIHTRLLIPRAGKYDVGSYLTGICALILLILTISGLRLWLPKKWSQLKSVLTVKKKAHWKRQNYDLHNVIGLYSSPIVSMLALTGFSITFYIPFVALLVSLTGRNPQKALGIYSMKSKYEVGVKRVDVNKIIQQGTTLFPNGKVKGLSVPTDTLGVYRLDIVCPSASKVGARHAVVIDQYSGKILGSSKEFPNVGQAFLSWMVPLHYGTFGGLSTRVLALLGGLVPLLLFITGFIIWRPRWKKQNHKKSASNITTEIQPDRRNIGEYFTQNLKLGFKYATYTLITAMVMAFIYGLFGWIFKAPIGYMIVFVGGAVVINAVVALLAMVFNLLFLAPFQKSKRSIYRYFALSLAFLIVIGGVTMIIINSSWVIF